MKKILLICLILVSANNLWSQKTYQLDSLISVSIPGDDIKIDSLKSEKHEIIIYSKTESSEYFAEKRQFVSDSTSSYSSELPYDLKSLDKLYKAFAIDFSKKHLLKIETEKLIEKDSCNGYYLKLSDSLNNVSELEYFLLNKNIYLFKYNSTSDLDNDEKELFFNAIKINADQRINQFTGKTPIEKSAYNIGYKIGHAIAKHPSYLWIAVALIVIFVLGIIFLIVKKI